MATEVTVIVDPDGGAGYDYTSLAAAIAGEARDLVTADEQLTIKCRCTGGTADGAATIDGFTTDATRYVKIWTDPSESYRHAGTYPTGNKYRIEVSNEPGIAIRDANIEIIGIAIQATDTGNSNTRGILITTGSVGIKIDKCLIVGICSGTGTGYGIYAYISTATVHVTSTVVQGWASGSDQHFAALYLYYGTPYIYNCTFTKSYRGVSSFNNGTHTIKNCIFFNNIDDIYTNGATQVIDHCASDDGDGTNPVNISPGATEATDWAACFTDYANGDFSLKSGSVCIGAGVGDPGSGLYSDDILGNTRTSPWDIGAFEYVSAAPPSFKAAWAINSNRVIQ